MAETENTLIRTFCWCISTLYSFIHLLLNGRCLQRIFHASISAAETNLCFKNNEQDTQKSWQCVDFLLFFIFDVVFICHWIQSYYDDIWSLTARCACVLVCILTTATVKLLSYQIRAIFSNIRDFSNICVSWVCSFHFATLWVFFVFFQSIVNFT